MSEENENQKIKKPEQEISDLRAEVSELRRSAEKYRSIFEALPVSIQVVDENGIITEVNPFHINHLGKGKTTIESYLHENVLTRESIIQAGLSEHYRRVLSGAVIDMKEVFFPTTTGGSYAYCNVKGVPIMREGRQFGSVFIIEDVTECKKAQDELFSHQEKLEELIEDRTRDLKNAYQSLHEENLERKKTEAEKVKLIRHLEQALKEVKTLTGLIPICASCKKIRDDKGFWNQIELYIREHSDAEFSHGICPDCAEKLYPGYTGNKEE